MRTLKYSGWTNQNAAQHEWSTSHQSPHNIIPIITTIKKYTNIIYCLVQAGICSFPSLQGVNQEIFSLGARFSIHSQGRDVLYMCVKLHFILPSILKIVRKSAESFQLSSLESFLTIIWMILIFRRRRSLGGRDSWSGIWGNVGIS